MSGIPTTYAGVRFRSRLEARWACVFDAWHWPWAYEPIDLEGYIPDFVVSFERNLLVEVKPDVEDSTLDSAKRKISDSGWPGESLIVSPVLQSDWAQPTIGWLGEPTELGIEWDLASAFVCLSCGQMSVLSQGGSWRCRVCGVGSDNSHVGAVASLVNDSWAEAGNRVQWRAS